MNNIADAIQQSIVTPGPTPPLLIATNLAFCVLQLVFFFLLLLTHSFHFVALSIVCGGLWWGINWFATEVTRAQAQAEASSQSQKSTGSDSAASKRKKHREQAQAAAGDADNDDDDSSGDSTEVEDESHSTPFRSTALPRKSSTRRRHAGKAGTPTPSDKPQMPPPPRREPTVTQASFSAGSSTPTKNATQPRAPSSVRSLSESVGELSTDSEWEKVEE